MIDVIEKLVEGYFVRTIDNLVFEIKGVVHPHNRLIAYVRYVPEFDSTKSEQFLRKIYDLQEREKYLKTNFPEYLWFSEAHQRILQSIPVNRVKQILSPVEVMNQIRKNTSTLARATTNLVDLLFEYTKIERESIGITGSQLVGVAKETSDIDLVVFGESACKDFYSKFSETYDEIPGISHYEGDLLRNHVGFRWAKLVDYQNILCEIESQKLLQGLFGKHQFFIRLVRLRSDIDEVYGQVLIKDSKSVEVECLITDDKKSIFTPCIYHVECSDYPLLRKLVSYRGRFTEHGSSGETVTVRGRLEDVINTNTDERYQQLILGEASSDFMIPV